MATGDGTNFATTSNMGLRMPTPGVCGGLGVEPPGLSWMEVQNSAMGIIDQHNHTPGLGALIPTAGIGINADLTFNGFNATGLRSARFGAITLGALGAADVGCLIVSGVDLYYVDINGNQIRITSSGAIAGTPGSITGLVSPAAATYTPASKLFSLTSSSGFAAGLSCGAISITDAQTLNGKSATLQAPVGLAGNYAMTLPAALPGANALLSLSTAGALSAFGTVSGSNLTLGGSLTVSGALVTSGAVTVAGQINGVSDPSASNQAATKNYVDNYSNAYAIYNVFAGGSFTSGNQINFDASEADPSSLVTTGASWRFTVPSGKGGVYCVTFFVTMGGTFTAGQTIDVYIYKNGSQVHLIDRAAVGTTSGAEGGTLIVLAAGDSIDLRLFTGGTSLSYNAGRISIIRVQ